MTVSMAIKGKWSDYCDSQGFENQIELIGAELLITQGSTLSFQKMLHNLKEGFEASEEDLRVSYPRKKKLYKVLRQDLMKMQTLGLVTIKEKIDSTRYIVHFNWLENLKLSS